MLLSQTSTWNNWPISLTQPRLLYESFAAELIANWSITNFIGHICKRMDYAKFERPTSLSLNQKFCLSLSQSHIFLFLPLSFTFLLFWVIFAFPQNLTFDFLGGPPRFKPLAFGLVTSCEGWKTGWRRHTSCWLCCGSTSIGCPIRATYGVSERFKRLYLCFGLWSCIYCCALTI